MCAGDPEAGPDGAQEVQAPLRPQLHMITYIIHIHDIYESYKYIYIYICM